MEENIASGSSVRVERRVRRVIDLSGSRSHQTDEHEAKEEQHNPKRPCVGVDVAEFSAKVFDLENGITGE